MPSSQQNVTNIPSNRVDFIDPRTGLVSREWYRFFVNLFNLSGAGGNQTSLDDLQVGPPPQPTSTSGGGGSGTVTSVDMTVPTGLAVSGNPITTAGTLAVTYASGYAIPTTAKQTEWDTAYTDRLKWDGGATGLVAATGRTSLGATTVGGNFFTLPNPSAITFVQINADNTITTMDAPTFRTAIGAGTGVGSVTSVGTAGTVNGLTLTGGPITTTGTITLGGTLDLSSPPAIGGTTPAAGTFTTLTATGQTDLGTGSAQYIRAVGNATAPVLSAQGSGTNIDLNLTPKGAASVRIVQGNSGANGLVLNQDSGVSANSARLFFDSSAGTSSIYNNSGNQLLFGTAAAIGSSSGTTQMRVTHTASAVNYVQVTGAATGSGVVVSAQGSDSNVEMQLRPKGSGNMTLQDGNATAGLQVITRATGGDSFLTVQRDTSRVNLGIGGGATNASMVILPKGTGAIDLAAGSSGVNISNGGTVTAITITANGSGYTSIPSNALTAPTTAGGVQAVASTAVQLNSFSIISGGTGYAVNDVVEITSGTFYSQKSRLNVTSVSGGAITGVSINQYGRYTVLPSAPDSVTTITGSGSGATLSYSSLNVFACVITNAGSGYVEQPTVSFSGGGGSGAAAYATVGSASKITSLFSFLPVYGPSGFIAAFQGSSGTAANYIQFSSQSTGNYPNVAAQGSDTNVGFDLFSKGTAPVRARTGTGGATQFQISDTASAVNYVQVTGSVTGPSASTIPSISVQGSDASTYLGIGLKGTSGYFQFYGNAASNNAVFRISAASASTTNNILSVSSAASGSAPSISALGFSDANVDIAFTPKGTGNVRFGTYTASVLAPTGYIEIKDSGGTTRRLLVG